MALAGISAIIVASAATQLAGVAGAVRQAGLGLVGAVAGLHAAALALGYLIPAGGCVANQLRGYEMHFAKQVPVG